MSGAGADRLARRAPDSGDDAGSTPDVPVDGRGSTVGGAMPRSSAPSGLTAGLPDRWSWPLAPRPAVVGRFRPPASAFGAGHRGVDLGASAGQPVLSVDAGRVTHAGVIAGRGTVTVLHASGVSSTYEPLEYSARTGDAVGRGQPLGILAASGSHCAPASCLHLGARRDRRYLDPLVLLIGGRVRLLPQR